MKTLKSRWTGGMQFTANTDTGHTIITDSPVDKGGQDSGPRPSELPLVGLAGCTGVDIVMILEKMKVKFDSLEISIEADPAEEHPKIWQEIRVKFTFTGNPDPKKVERAIKLSHEKYCSVGAMLGAAAKISYEYEILPA